MQIPKMGGQKKLRIFIKGNDDLTDSLLSLQEGGQKLDRGLRDLINEKYHGVINIEVIHEPGGRSDLVLQQLVTVPLPGESRQQDLGDEEDVLVSQFRTRLFEEQMDVVVFSIQPEITHFLPAGFVQVRQFKENVVRLIRVVKERLGAHIIVYNCSSLDPDDHTYNYYNKEDTLSIRAQKFNLALMEVSALEGISIIDVDRLMAELGGERHVMKALHYSTTAYEAIRQEFLRVVEDIGFFENRPLVMQVGGKKEDPS